MLTKPLNVEFVPPVFAQPAVAGSTLCPGEYPPAVPPGTHTVTATQDIYLLNYGGVSYQAVVIIMPSGTTTTTFTPALPSGVSLSPTFGVLLSSTSIQVTVPSS